MPNWASVVYVCKADKQQLKDLYDKLETMNHSEKSILENGFGIMWLGNLVYLLGGQWEAVECRGEITHYYYRDEGKLLICFEHAWGDSDNLRDFLKQCYPGMKISFSVEEFENEVFVTNDIKEFPDRYYLDISDDDNNIDDPDYYTNLKDVVDVIQRYYGVKLDQDYDEIYSWLENKAEESECFGFVFCEVKVVDE